MGAIEWTWKCLCVKCVFHQLTVFRYRIKSKVKKRMEMKNCVRFHQFNFFFWCACHIGYRLMWGRHLFCPVDLSNELPRGNNVPSDDGRLKWMRGLERRNLSPIISYLPPKQLIKKRILTLETKCPTQDVSEVCNMLILSSWLTTMTTERRENEQSGHGVTRISLAEDNITRFVLQVPQNNASPSTLRRLH